MASLPQFKVFDAVKACIYCGRTRADGYALTREHIIPRALGGALVLPEASCEDCRAEITTFEAPLLNQTLTAVRTHLQLPMYDPKFRPADLRLAKFDSTGEWPNMDEANLRFVDTPIAQHPLVIALPNFLRPGILRDAAPSPQFTLRPSLFQVHGEGPSINPLSLRQAAEMRPFSPDGVCREIAKIAHGAARAVLGLAFDPILPEVILGKEAAISHYVGTGDEEARPSQNLHEVWLDDEAGFIIAKVQLFARYGFRPYEAVVGKTR